MIALNEYGHSGNKRTNNGKNSGQYFTDGKGGFTSWYSDFFCKSENIDHGNQKHKVSVTGHRGTDIEFVGFGVESSLDKGKYSFDKINVTNSKEKYRGKMPSNASGTAILKTLGVK